MALVHRLSPPFLSAGMGTVVEHPLFALGEIQNNMEANARRNSIEIIDVDAHGEPSGSNSSSSQGPSRPRVALRQRNFHPDSIISLVDDSDDEVQILSDPIQDNRQETSNRRRFRSPPYSFMDTPPPPVPPIPRRYSGFASFPTSQVPPPPISAPPVRPNHRPFAFEQNLYHRDPSAVPLNHRQLPFLPPSRRPTVPQVTGDMSAAAHSHHLPSMGLGGALISSNNARAQQAATQTAARVAARINHAIRRPMSWLVTAANLDDLIIDDSVDNPPHIRRWLESQRDSFVTLYNSLHGGPAESQAKYLQAYTHPDQPEPGFTFDFAPNASDDDSSRERRFPPTSANAPIIVGDDDEQPSVLLGGSSASSINATTLSSKTPVAGTEPGKLTIILVCAKCMTPLLLNESLGPDDSERRVWALRCGHMIDELCLNDIGQPDEEPDLDKNSQQAVVDRKGKGKAKLKPKPPYGEAVVEPPHSSNIRSRLRSATSSSSPSVSLSSQPPPTKRRRAAAVAHKIEAEFEWKCPVPSCQVVHASVKIDGNWGPEKDAKQPGKVKARGAIPVFA